MTNQEPSKPREWSEVVSGPRVYKAEYRGADTFEIEHLKEECGIEAVLVLKSRYDKMAGRESTLATKCDNYNLEIQKLNEKNAELSRKLAKAVEASSKIKACIEQHNFDTDGGVLGDYFKVFAELNGDKLFKPEIKELKMEHVVCFGTKFCLECGREMGKPK